MLALLLAAAAPASAAVPPRFDPIRFFAGATEGRGRLKVVLRRTRDVRVRGTGRVDRDGALVLDQRVEREGKPLENRRWVIRRVAPSRYAGTLTDAAGPVTGQAEGDRLRLSFPGKGGVRIEQRLTLAPDGRSAANRLTVRKLGVVVAVLHETIRRVD